MGIDRRSIQVEHARRRLELVAAKERELPVAVATCRATESYVNSMVIILNRP